MACGSSSTGRVLKCFKCGVKGHKANMCPTKAVDKSRGKYKHSANSVDGAFAASHTVLNSDCAYEAKTKTDGKPWILDSGCTTHFCGDDALFEKINKAPKVRLNLASGATAEVKGKGEVRLSVGSDRDQKLIEFRNALYVPDLRTNLVSVAKITDKDHEVTFNKDCAIVRGPQGDVMMIADRKGDLYYLRENVECAEVGIRSAADAKLRLWHERLGHLNSKDLVKLVNNKILPKMDVKDAAQLSCCDVCLKGKMTALPFPKNRQKCREVLGIVHSDVVGPFRTESTGRAKYFVLFIDDCTRWCEVYFLRRKCGVLEAFKLYKQLAERQTGKKIKCLQSDNGREYCNGEFDRYLAEHGIKRRLSVPHTPQQNGVSERMNRTLLDMGRCLLLQSGLGALFWSEAIATACYIRNRCPTSSLDGAIPYEKWTNKRNNVSYFKKFGSKVVVLDKDQNKDKLAPRSLSGVFMGYPRERKGFRVWIPSMRKLIEARDVKFDEDIKVGSYDASIFEDFITSAETPGVSGQRETVELSPHPVESTERRGSSVQTPEVKVIAPKDEKVRRARGRPALLRTGKRGRPRKLFRSRSVTPRTESDGTEEVSVEDGLEDDVFAGVAEISVKDALESEVSDEWLDAIESEVTSLVKNNTWEIIRKDDNKNIVGCRLVLTNKYDTNGDIVKRKARLVAKGYNQKYGVNYHQTYAPVARLETLRLMLAIAAQFGMKIWQFDVVTAYLNGSLEEEVIMKVPEMLNEMLQRIVSRCNDTTVRTRASRMIAELRHGGNACKLKKALYGLKQAGRQWYAKLSEKLLSIGFKSTKNEPCLFHLKRENCMILVLVYVDDILIASNDVKYVDHVKQKLLKHFELKDIGLAEYCLGLEINQNEKQIELSQAGYIAGLLKQYGMENCNPVATPSEVNARFEDADGSDSQEEYPYRELIGALMYLSVATRPDIANTVSRLAQFVEKPRKCHWLAAKRVLRYLAGTVDFGLVYSKVDEPLTAYSDSDWGGCTIDRRSYSGYVFLLSGAAITWKSQKQRTVALSSAEAEYVSLAEAAKEALYLHSLLCELHLTEWAKITIFVDNRGAQCLANDPVFHARTKHVDIRYHFIRESISGGSFSVKHVPTEEMIADALTKPLPRIRHEKCRDGFGFGHK